VEKGTKYFLIAGKRNKNYQNKNLERKNQYLFHGATIVILLNSVNIKLYNITFKTAILFDPKVSLSNKLNNISKHPHWILLFAKNIIRHNFGDKNKHSSVQICAYHANYDNKTLYSLPIYLKYDPKERE